MKDRKNNTSEIGFEKQLWKAADKLRGSMDASQYKYIILGLIFLKYLSDIFEQKYKELVEEGDGLENDIDAYLADNIFFVPEDARWEKIAAKAHTSEIGITINNAMKSIEDNNPKLKNVLPNDFADPDLNQLRLGDVVDLFTNIKIPANSNEKDILGRCYEYCLGQFASQEGRNAGEFYTPSCIVRTIVEIMQPFEGRIYDPCCGAGGMFVQSAKFVQAHGGNLGDVSVFGQESNPTTWKLAQMNLAIRGIEANLGSYADDTFTNDLHAHEKMDFIMANPPFNNKEWWHESLREDYRWKYGIPPENNANFAWIEHMIAHLSPKGKIGLVLANGALTSNQNEEREIRKNIIEADLAECIIALPPQLFYNTTIPASLWFLNRKKSQSGKTLFIDARKMGTLITRRLRELSDNDINFLASTYRSFTNGNLKSKIGFCSIKTTEDIKANNYLLSPGIYVDVESETENNEEEDNNNISILENELKELFYNSHNLEKEILKSFLEH